MFYFLNFRKNCMRCDELNLLTGKALYVFNCLHMFNFFLAPRFTHIL